MQNKHYIPGLLLTLLLAGVSTWLGSFAIMSHAGLSALPLAIIGGMVIGNTIYPRYESSCASGVGFSKQQLLRLGIVLYGLRLTFQDIAAVGLPGIMSDLLVLCSTFGLAYWLGTRRFGLDAKSAILIGAGSSICGAAAVLATEPVVKGGPEKVAVAVATVVVFGSVSMFLYPLIFRWIPSLPQHFGIYIGSTVHEVAQVVVAARSSSPQAEDAAVITKMIRVMMLAPFLVGLSAWRGTTATDGAKRQITIPWFALGFIAVAGLHSYIRLPQAAASFMLTLDNLLLAMAMGALGLCTHIRSVRQAGLKPLALAGLLYAYLIVGGALINLGVERLLG